ncbi:hypothetical protein Pelo_15306 [Pelomyxa schiedti]|nr:hypothetical protein Pelo_15306 [Pelomyxa schiedti]
MMVDATHEPAVVAGHQQIRNKLVTTYTRVTCKDQFSALLTSSVSRCGARSPARDASCNSQLMHAMWRHFIVGSAHWFVLVLEPDFSSSDKEWVTVTFGVSPTMMGITHSPSLIRRCEGEWLGPGMCMLYRTDKDRRSFSLFLSHNGADEGACIGSNLTQCRHCANRKWLLVWKVSVFGDGEHTLNITDIQQLQSDAQREKGTTTVPTVVIPFLETSFYPSAYGIEMNKANPDEVLVWSVNCDVAYFTLLDVPQTYRTNVLAVVNSTEFSLPPWRTFHQVVILRRLSGEVVYAVNVHVLSNEGQRHHLLFLVESSTGE